VGTQAFNEFVAASKKDFIIFQLEVMLKEAGNDVNKKSTVVNQIAETLSKINKAEDFTKLQDYIRQCAGLLRIDESGLTNLVNKYKRDRIVKDEKRSAVEEAARLQEQAQQPEDVLDDTQLLFNQDEAHERNMLRVLLEYGLRPWDETRTMADYIFEELEQFHFDNPKLEALFEEYKKWYLQGLEPTTKTLLYHENESIRDLVVSISVFPFELSQKWDEVMETMNIVNRDTSAQDVLTSVNFYKLRKIKKMFEENQRDMEHASIDEQMRLIELHKHLKDIERELTKQLGTVIIK
jgi:DNA primase